MKRYLGFALIITIFLFACAHDNKYEFQGYVETELVYISSPVSGHLQTLAVRRGMPVKTNDLLFKLEEEPELSDFNQANKNLLQAQALLANAEKGNRETVIQGLEAQLAQAKTNVRLSEIRVNRYRTLLKSKAIDKDTVDAFETELKKNIELVNQYTANLAEAKLGSRNDVIRAQAQQVEASRAQMEKTKWLYDQKKQVSPVDGSIYDTFYREGEYIAAAHPVVAILSPLYLDVQFYVPEPVLSLIKINDVVSVYCDNCKQVYQAKIYYISPQAEYTPPVIYSRAENYKYVFRIRAKLEAKDAEYLHPGQPVYVRLTHG